MFSLLLVFVHADVCLALAFTLQGAVPALPPTDGGEDGQSVGMSVLSSVDACSGDGNGTESELDKEPPAGERDRLIR